MWDVGGEYEAAAIVLWRLSLEEVRDKCGGAGRFWFALALPHAASSSSSWMLDLLDQQWPQSTTRCFAVNSWRQELRKPTTFRGSMPAPFAVPLCSHRWPASRLSCKFWLAHPDQGLTWLVSTFSLTPFPFLYYLFSSSSYSWIRSNSYNFSFNTFMVLPLWFNLDWYTTEGHETAFQNVGNILSLDLGSGYTVSLYS